MYIRLIIIFVLLFSSCSRKENAIGENNDLIIFSSSEDKEFIDLYLSSIINKTINTPIEEYIYNVVWAKPSDFHKYKYYKNVIIASLTNPPDDTIDLLYDKFNRQYKNEKIYSLTDLYSIGQIFLILGGLDSIEFGSIIKKNISWITKEIDENIKLNILNKFSNIDLNNEIVEMIINMYDIDIDIGLDYKVLRRSDNFLWIGRGYPYRWIVFSKFSIYQNIDKNNLWSLLENNFSDNKIPITISEYYRKNIISDEFILLRGLYEHPESDTGGPFFTYMFENVNNNEVILISGFVNNPGKEKYLLLKELEVLIENTKRN